VTDEERQRQMDFIVSTLARITASTEAQAQANTDAHTQHTIRLDRLERVAKLMVSAGLRARRQMREQDTRINTLIDSQIRTEERINTLIDSQIRTEERINTLIDSQSGQSGNAKL